MRQNSFGVNSAILFCFNLLEAYLNGLAWDYVRSSDISELSNRKRKLLEDNYSISIRDKLKKYPEIISKRDDIWKVSANKNTMMMFLDTMKPFRDSLVHPSPFSTPEKLGGYDKLRLLYQTDSKIALQTANLLVSLIETIHVHIFGEDVKFSDWTIKLKQGVENLKNKAYKPILSKG